MNWFIIKNKTSTNLLVLYEKYMDKLSIRLFDSLIFVSCTFCDFMYVVVLDCVNNLSGKMSFLIFHVFKYMQSRSFWLFILKFHAILYIGLAMSLIIWIDCLIATYGHILIERKH